MIASCVQKESPGFSGTVRSLHGKLAVNALEGIFLDAGLSLQNAENQTGFTLGRPSLDIVPILFHSVTPLGFLS